MSKLYGFVFRFCATSFFLLNIAATPFCIWRFSIDLKLKKKATNTRKSENRFHLTQHPILNLTKTTSQWWSKQICRNSAIEEGGKREWPKIKTKSSPKRKIYTLVGLKNVMFNFCCITYKNNYGKHTILNIDHVDYFIAIDNHYK